METDDETSKEHLHRPTIIYPGVDSIWNESKLEAEIIGLRSQLEHQRFCTKALLAKLDEKDKQLRMAVSALELIERAHPLDGGRMAHAEWLIKTTRLRHSKKSKR